LFEPQSWNRYAYTDNNPLAYIDPDGMEKLKVTLTVYIPGKTIKDPFGRTYNANGNGRGITPLDYKTRQTVTIETDARKAPATPLIDKNGKVGETLRYDKNGNIIGRGKESDSAVNQGAERKSDGSVNVNFSGSPTNPLGLPGTPSIDYDINVTCAGASCAAQSGAHDGFPAYRVEVTDESGATNEIYNYDPQKAGNGPTALFPPMDCKVPKSKSCSSGQSTSGEK
jgi:hypothetical protein